MSASFNQTSPHQEKLMALKPVDLTSTPEETARVAKAAFPKGNIYLKLRDELGALYQDETFSHLFPSAGCPAESPGRLAMITVFQFAEGLSDRAAASFSSPSKRSFTASSAPTTRIVGKTRT